LLEITRVVWASSAVFYGPLRDNMPSASRSASRFSIISAKRTASNPSGCATNFTPYPDFIAYGLGLLGGGGLDRRDAAAATARAVDALLAGTIGDEWFDVTTISPFNDQQAVRWADDPWAVLDEAFPADGALLRRHLATLPTKLGTERADKLIQQLGYTPRYSFATFVEELHVRDRSGDLSAPDGYSVHQG
jgi:hypothetical protein